MNLQFSPKIKGLIQLALVIAFILTSFAISNILQTNKPQAQEKNAPDKALFVETENVGQGVHNISFYTTGTVEAITNIDVIPQVSGQIINVNQEFYNGGEFKKNSVLFEIDPRDFRLEVERLEAEVARASTSLTLEKAESKAALSEWRQRNGSKIAPDLVARKPQLAEARANLKAAKALLKNAELDLERTKIRMPFNGRVLSSQVATGRFVSAGQSIAQVFDRSTLEIRASLPSQKLEWLLQEKNPNIIVTTSYLGETKKYRGYLKRGTSSFDANTRFANVSFGIDNANTLIPGVFTRIDIKGHQLNGITRLPSSAIQKGGVIWAVDEKNKLIKLQPDIIESNDIYVAASGLDGNFQVVVSRLDGGEVGMKVMRNELVNKEREKAL